MLLRSPSVNDLIQVDEVLGWFLSPGKVEVEMESRNLKNEYSVL